MMFYALVIICLASLPVCDLDHAVDAEQSPPVFDSLESCRDGARRHVAQEDHPRLKVHTEYQIEIECEAANNGA